MRGWMLAGLATLVLSSTSPAQAARQEMSATIQGNPGEWFGPDAYPAEALKAEEQGRVIALLSVDPTGKVLSCSIELGASPSLNRATCDIALARAVFQPAKDARGKPVSGTYRLPVRWILPDGDPFATYAGTMIIRLAPDGTMISCKFETTGAIHEDDTGGACRTLNPQAPVAVLGPYAGKAAVVSMRRAVTVGDAQPAGLPPAKPDQYIAKRERVRVTVAKDGSLASCAVIDSIGPLPTGDLCAIQKQFQPAAAGNDAPRTGIVEMSITVDAVDPADTVDEPTAVPR